MIVKIKRIHPHAVVPSKGTPQSAAFDLYIPYYDDAIFIRPGVISSVSLGFATEIPEGYYASVHIRSSLGKKGVVLSNSTGIIDSDYRGEWKIMLTSIGSGEQIVMPGERVAQVIFRKVEHFEFEECNDLSDTSRGVGGFGSTGS